MSNCREQPLSKTEGRHWWMLKVTMWSYFKGRDSPDHMSGVTAKQKKARALDHYLPRRNNQFLKIWLKKFPWLVYDEMPNLMFCGLCRKHGVKSRGSQASLSRGTDSFSSEFLRAHQLSEAHAQASLMEAAKGSPGTGAASELTVRAWSKVTLGRVENLFRSCHALAKTGRPLGDFIWMCELDEMKGVDIGPVFRTQKSARTFTYFIAEAERRNLREQLEKSPFFSVISDGLSAGTMEKAELVYVQFAHAGQVHCQLVGVQTAEKKDPLSVKIAIEKTLERNLQLRLSDAGWADKLVGFARDGAPGSEGENSELALLFREIQPRVLTVYCLAHHLELSYEAVFRSVPLYADVRDVLRGVRRFSRRSPPRKCSPTSTRAGPRLRPGMPARAGARTWLQGLREALQSFLRAYPAIVQQLRSVSSVEIQPCFSFSD